MDSSLSARLDAIEQTPRADTRGAELERLVADVFRQHHFDVLLNPGTARPRQTDVLATKAAETYLIECKYRKDKATIDDIDSLRARLRRTDGAVVGILVSMAGFTGSVLFDVEHHRDQPILLISGDELRRSLGWRDPLAQMLWRKKQALLTDGRVLLDEPTRPARRTRRRVELPAAASQFLFPDGRRSHVLDCDGSFGQFVFAHHLPDIDWVPAPGTGVTLDVRPDVLDQSGLLNVIDKLAALGWASADARWSIQQSTRNWHGLGCAAFAQALPDWRPRAATPSAHHSEEICYIDRCDGGFYTLTTKLLAHSFRQTTMTMLSFQLHGIPLDTGPLLQLCRSLGAHDDLYFRPRSDQSVSRLRHGSVLVDDVEPVGYLITPETLPGAPDDEWVTGIIIVNPFRDVPGGDQSSNRPEGLDMLAESELLICDLRHHHRHLDGHHYAYHLQGLEHAWSTECAVYRPVANWTRDDEDGDEQPPNVSHYDG